jgi:hypothetical protein
MVALMKRVFASWIAHEPVQQPVQQGSYPGELTADQKAYLHEKADERRRQWREHARETSMEHAREA